MMEGSTDIPALVEADMVDHTAERTGIRNRMKELIVQAVRPVLKSEEFEHSLRGIIAEYVKGPEFTEAIRAACLNSIRDAGLAAVVQSSIAQSLRDPAAVASDYPSSAARVDKGTQILLTLKYQELLRTKAPLPKFDEVGFRAFSQFDEDGILLFIFSLIGTTNRKAVEACAGVGYECISANLIVNHGWDALLLDGSEQNCMTSWKFYTTRSDTQITPPKVIHTWIEPETIDGIITGNGFTGEIDLLTIDLDGVDYWIWKNIRSINPRVVVVEYQPWFGADEPYTVKNIKGYNYPDYAETKKGYVGCSLAAYVNLAREKGYRLIGCNRNQLNAFFLRNDIANDLFPEVTVASCLTHRRVEDMNNWIRKGHVEAQIQNGDWERV